MDINIYYCFFFIFLRFIQICNIYNIHILYECTAAGSCQQVLLWTEQAVEKSFNEQRPNTTRWNDGLYGIYGDSALL